jgi:PAS domain S-box-containing protein
LAISDSEAEITASLVDFRNRLIIIFVLVFIGIIFLTYYGIKAWIIIRESQLRTIAENNLKESEEKYRTIIEATKTGYAVLGFQKKLIDANHEYAKMTGYSKREDILGKTIEVITTPKNSKNIHTLIDNCIKENKVQHSEMEFIHENGSIIPVEITASILQTKPVSTILICRNLTEQKKAREELMKERTWLRTLIDNLPSGVFIKDAQYRKIIANSIHLQCVKSHLKSIGHDPDFDVLGKTDFEVYEKEDAELYMLDDSKVIEKGHSIINQVEPGLGPHNEKIWLLVSKVPLRANDGTIIGMVGITTEITEQKIIEEQLTLAKDKAEQSDRLKTAFLNNISHEIRTPLNAIMGFSNLLKDQDITKDKSDYFIDIIQQSSNQLLHIITDIINIATIETGQLTVNLSKIDLNSVLSILYEQYKGAAAFKKLTFNFSTALSDSDAIIETDSTKFTEVFSNIINNAIKFTEKGAVLFGYQLEQDTLIFFVEDTGIGIAQEYHSAIFDRFRQVDGPVSQKYGGTGLGLSISKTYIELLGGSIWLKSEPNEGSTFYFTLPYKKAKL